MSALRQVQTPPPLEGLLYRAAVPFSIYLGELLFALDIRAIDILGRAAATNIAAVAARAAAAAEPVADYPLAFLARCILNENRTL